MRSPIFALSAIRWLLLTVSLLSGPTASRATDYYATDFSGFSPGDDTLSGHDGWLANNSGRGVHGIVSDSGTGLGQSAFLGYARPASSPVRLWHAVGSPAAVASPSVLHFQAAVGISSSTTGGNDAFSLAFYNATNGFLAALNLDTAAASYGVWTDDGLKESSAGSTFFTDQVSQLEVDIDPGRNLWWAYLDGIPLFSAIPFTHASGAANIGYFSFEWLVANLADPGDNWLLIDNVSASTHDLRITSLTRGGDGSATLRWTSPAATGCLVESSRDLLQWNAPAGGLVTAPSPGASLSFTDSDPDPASGGRRFYRIRQTDILP